MADGTRYQLIASSLPSWMLILDLTIDSIARTWIGNAIEIVFAILVTVT